MFIRCLFVQRKESYPGEYLPELVAAADEGTIDENPSWFDEQCERGLENMGDECVAKKILDIQIDDKKLQEMLSVEIPTIRGEIDSPSIHSGEVIRGTETDGRIH